MDYQRACGMHYGRIPQGIRTPVRTPYAHMHSPMPRMPEENARDPMEECCEHLAIVTSPVQCWKNLYMPCEALSMGTLFVDLNLPLVGCPGATYRRM